MASSVETRAFPRSVDPEVFVQFCEQAAACGRVFKKVDSILIQAVRNERWEKLVECLKAAKASKTPRAFRAYIGEINEEGKTLIDVIDKEVLNDLRRHNLHRLIDSMIQDSLRS